MATEFQKHKVAGVFTAMDINGDGFLEEQDFQGLAERWSAVEGSDSEQIHSVMMGWWAALSSAADHNRDNKVTLDEVMLVVDQLPGMRESVVGTANSMFDAIDSDGDDRISSEEYSQVVAGWKGYAADTSDIFPRLDLNSDGYLSRDEFADLWFEFWAGADESSPSKYVFGSF
jgi:Ca2+-binding EF-hand superfamily protein